MKMADGTDKWVAFIGGGFDSTLANYNSGSQDNRGVLRHRFIDGTKLWEYYNATGSTDDRQYMNFSLPASPTAVDLNNDGYIDRVYIGDVGGQLWKFDVAPLAARRFGWASDELDWQAVFARRHHQTNPPAAGEYYPTQAIYFPPTLAYDASGNLWIFIREWGSVPSEQYVFKPVLRNQRKYHI